MEEKNKEKTSKQESALRYASVGTQMMVYLGLGVWGGLKLDELAHTNPLFIVTLPIIALVVSLYQLYKQLTKPNK